MTPPLSVNHVSKSFAGKQAVDDVSFTVKPGEIVGFLGPNGAGKTTTLRMALGLVKPDSGRVELFGRPPSAHIFGRIGFLPEERGLYKKQNAREAIAHLARLNGMGKRDAFKRADAMLERYGLGDARKKKNKDMSKGMAQKVQLLAAIAHDPEFYILDEPFSGLDPVNQQVLESIVREIAGQGRTIIFSTHVMEHAERLCDRIILMSGGRKVFDGSTEAALNKAPRRLVLDSDNDALLSTVTPFAGEFIRRDDGAVGIVLKDTAEAHDVLEACVNKGVKLKRFEPKQASLHEAFVAMVGQDVVDTMGDDAFAANTGAST
ncbi:ABC transporter ATP-binding protein [Fretibacter rubidus]|uniref:ABC transporter ATP-binding protein n=1 Tax=Fretibacter rubidus TaxID=570162 RepID=UPI00352A1A64